MSTPTGPQSTSMPRVPEKSEVPEHVESCALVGRRAVEAGCDGSEPKVPSTLFRT
ncbi:hypothetical protein [Streptomyces sp. WZ.A104]|uniref:hypothetical protein n=1 Tax=Streptomyces sp. WZ.A104 TaxID=2023771 RepID=UPI0015C8B402|nr:hypothetical protein [Streptomyces sp. WZ.A104]